MSVRLTHSRKRAAAHRTSRQSGRAAARRTLVSSLYRPLAVGLKQNQEVIGNNNDAIVNLDKAAR
jgi:hypothetical protein